jgi:signal transduction histidine kinase
MSSVTHELRTPLTSIRALTELMRDEPEMDEAQRQQFLSIVVSESERLSRLVNQVLDMAKIESGHAEWLSADVDLAALLQQALLSTSELLRERGATAQLHLPTDPVPLLRADPDRLLQVVLNLLSNAAKFVPREGGRVDVLLSVQHGRATVEVQDNGPGVPPAQQALVFEKFRQGGDDKHRPQGTGLGLPISRKIVEHFGGRLWLDPRPGPGACFVFDIPLQTQQTQQTQEKPP